MNLGMLLHSTAIRNPPKAALIDASRHQVVSYEQLDRSTTLLAQRFLADGCRAGDRIAIHWTNSIEVVTLFFACFKAGLIAVPVNVRMKAAEIVYVLAHSKAVLCFSQPELAHLAKEAGRECGSLRGIHTTIGELPLQASDAALPEVTGDAPALILYTSGTTARPKGVTHSH